MATKLGKYFKLEEFTRSDTAKKQKIDNTPNTTVISNLKYLVKTVLDPMREAWMEYCKKSNISTEYRIIISSGYRSNALNAAVGGSDYSAHMSGLAADIKPYNKCFSHFKIFCIGWLLESKTKFDQVISEHEDAYGVPRCIHIGIKGLGVKHGYEVKKMTKTLDKNTGKYKYKYPDIDQDEKNTLVKEFRKVWNKASNKPEGDEAGEGCDDRLTAAMSSHASDDKNVLTISKDDETTYTIVFDYEQPNTANDITETDSQTSDKDDNNDNTTEYDNYEIVFDW